MSMYQRCKKCYQPMTGVYKNEKPARERCESCGGNTTAYNQQVPNPESGHAKRQQQSEGKE